MIRKINLNKRNSAPTMRKGCEGVSSFSACLFALKSRSEAEPEAARPMIEKTSKDF